MATPLLYLCYFFPPLSGPGVQRNLKNAKYLPDFGWDPIVLTVRDIVYHAYEPGVLSELGPDPRVHRTESLDFRRLAYRLRGLLRRPGGGSGGGSGGADTFRTRSTRALLRLRDLLALPDAYWPWVPFAVREGVRLVEEHDLPVVLARVSPLSAGVAAHLIAWRTGRPYVLDFADGWVDNPHLPTPSRAHARAQAALERRIVGGAAGVTVYSQQLKDAFLGRYPWLEDRIEVIPNGYDAQDFEAFASVERDLGRPKIVYMGSLYPHQEKNFETLIEALDRLSPALRAELEVEFVGNAFQGAQDLVRRRGLEGTVRFLGHRPHAVALEHLARAAAGLIFIKPGDTTMVTGKVFEYLALRVPILANIPADGQCAEVLGSVDQATWISRPGDATALAAHLESLAVGGWARPMGDAIDRFDRRKGAERLAGLLAEVLEKHPEVRE